MVARSRIERDRHLRAIWYVIVAFGLAAIAHLLLNFDQVQALGYAVSCFIMLNLVNYRTMFARLPEDSALDESAKERAKPE